MHGVRRALAALLGAGAAAVPAALAMPRPAGAVATTSTTAAALTFRLVWSTGPLNDKGGPIAGSSPMLATLDGGGPAMVVGDRTGYLYAYHLSDGSPVAGWPAYDGGAPIDSTPSVAALGPGDLESVFVGTGNAQYPATGGYEAYGPGGQLLWHSTVQNPPTDNRPDGGVQASLTVGDLQDGTDVFAGSLGQEAYGLAAASGSSLAGWPAFSADSIFSTAAVGDLYGSGQDELVVGGASTRGVAYGLRYQSGGHVRVLDAEGQLLYDVDTDQEVDSSPAIGPFLAGGATGIVVGTGYYYAGASDTDKVLAFNTRLVPAWSETLDGCTESSPALIRSAGQLDVVEGTDLGPANCGGRNAGSVWVLDGQTGAPLCHAPVESRVIGSVVAFDPTGNGRPDLLVPTIHGMEVLTDTCQKITVLGHDLGFQDSALVTDDPNGTIGITIAGYNGNNQGVIEHYEIPGSNVAAVDSGASPGPGSWPMFHHDPSLSGTSAPLPYLGTLTPTNLVAEAGDGQVSLSWTPPQAGGAGPVIGYDVYEGTSPGHESSTPVNAAPLSGTTDTITDLSSGTTYYFEVTAVNAAGQGAPVEVAASPLPPPPSSPSVVVPSPPGVPPGLFTLPTSAVVQPSAATTVSVTSGPARVAVTVPAGALPDGTTIAAGPASNAAAVMSYLPTTNGYITSFSVSWVTPSGTSPSATAPITTTIDDPHIRAGDGVYAMTPSGLKLVATATANGVAAVTFTSDPAFVVATLPKLRLVSAHGRMTKRTLVYRLSCFSWVRCTGTARIEVARKTSTGYRFPTVALKWGFSIWGRHAGPVHLKITHFGKAMLARASGAKRYRMTLVVQLKGGRRVVLPVYLG